MTLRPSAANKRSRWLALLVVSTTMLLLAASFASAHGVTSVPARYVGGTQVDIDPPPGPAVNDVPGQVDMTQMGRDTSANPDVRIFWNWDSISSWAGNGQTGDACALFDTDDTDAFINYVVCARVQNNGTPGDVVLLPASANHPAYLFDCSNKKNDRCTNPVPRVYAPGGVLAGPLTVAGTLTQTGAGDLITETDPFGAGESSPHDTSLEILVDDTLVPATVRLANVCSYPSAGNGGNNNPFDCVVTPGVQFGILRVTKVVNNDNGGTATAPNFSFSVDGGAAVAFEADGTNDVTVPVGNHSVTETVIATGYTASYANSLNSNTNCTSLAVTVGGTTTCTITNNDQAPSLTLVKTIDNGNGGTAAATAWTLRADKSPVDGTYELNGTTPVNSGATFTAGTYNLSETGPGGYTASAWSCVKNGGAAVEGSSITLTITDTATCTINNNDQAPSLTLVKTITNDNGGGAAATAWTLRADKSPVDGTYELSGTTPVNSGATFTAGTYNLSETGPGGYTASAWSCVKNGGAAVEGSSITLTITDTATCTINNNDQAPSLTLIKNVKNNSGGTNVATDWTLSASGTGGFAGATLSSITTETGYNSSASTGVKTVTAGITYALSESATPGGYTAGNWACTGGTQGTGADINKITLAVGESATCRIANDDNIATPLISTTMKWTLNDRTVMTGWVSGGGASTVTFRLYKDDGTNVSCEPATLVATIGPITVDDADGSAATTTGYTTEVTGTYHWIASFNGNSFNAPIATACSAETTNLP